MFVLGCFATLASISELVAVKVANLFDIDRVSLAIHLIPEQCLKLRFLIKPKLVLQLRRCGSVLDLTVETASPEVELIADLLFKFWLGPQKAGNLR